MGITAKLTIADETFFAVKDIDVYDLCIAKDDDAAKVIKKHLAWVDDKDVCESMLVRKPRLMFIDGDLCARIYVGKEYGEC